MFIEHKPIVQRTRKVVEEIKGGDNEYVNNNGEQKFLEEESRRSFQNTTLARLKKQFKDAWIFKDQVKVLHLRKENISPHVLRRWSHTSRNP